MRVHFQEKPVDLYAAVGYALAMSTVLLILNVGNPLAIFLVLFVPGYVLVGALFPMNTEIDWTERIALSLGLSIAVVPLLGLLLNFTPFGIRFESVVATILVFTVGVGSAAYWRRMQVPRESRLAASITLGVLDWREYNVVDKGLTFALAASIILAAATLAYVVLKPRPGETFTEFYILGPGGNASGYPTDLAVNETGSVILGIANHESARVTYTIRIDLVGVQIVHNATSGSNETVEINSTTWSTLNVSLADRQNWTQSYTFLISYTGIWKVQFLLFKDGDFSSAYRSLHLFVRET